MLDIKFILYIYVLMIVIKDKYSKKKFLFNRVECYC